MKTNVQLLLVAGISLLVGYFFGINKVSYEWRQFKPQVSVINRQPPQSITSSVNMAQMWDVWDKVNALYYDKKALDQQKMLNGAISGLVSSLGDPYTMYLPPVQNTSFQQQLAGKFEGIGAELGLKGKQVIVVAPLAGSPAEKAGVKAGDAIVKVDNNFTDGWTLPQAVDKIRGPKGTQVALGIVHKDAKDITTITITRDTIQVKSVEGWIKQVKDIDGLSDSFKSAHTDKKVMYLRLSQFGDTTNQDWNTTISGLQNKKDNISGMILDLRNNPGGYLTNASFIAGEFLKIGTPVVTEDNGNGDTNTLSVDRQGTLLDVPLIVLLNGGSASASEIVAGALRDNSRARLVGDQSFGKGTVQQSLDLGQGAGLHVTIAKWLTPKGTWVHQKGLTPDVKVSLDPKDNSHDTQLEAAIGELLK